MKKKYLPSYKRVENPPNMRLTARDKQIILAVYKYRILTSSQVEALFFRSNKPHGRLTSCQRRLQLLFHHGFLDRLTRPIILGEGRSALTYVMAEKGANLVARLTDRDRSDIDWKPKHNVLGPDFIDHTLAINNFRIATELLAITDLIELTGWIDERQFRRADMKNRIPIRQIGARVVRNYPDGYFTLRLPSTHQDAHFFVEIDQGTMSNTRWKQKIIAYEEFRNRGLSERYYGSRNFRVLTITASERRLNNLKKSTEAAGGNRFFWFTTPSKFDMWQPHKLLGAIWSVATQDEKLPLFS